MTLISPLSATAVSTGPWGRWVPRFSQTAVPLNASDAFEARCQDQHAINQLRQQGRGPLALGLPLVLLSFFVPAGGLVLGGLGCALTGYGASLLHSAQKLARSGSL